jgi:hypothetical protein
MTSEQVESVLSGYEPRIADLCRDTIALIHELLADAVVSVSRNIIGYGVGPGYTGLIFTVTPAKKHVTLGLSHAAELPDPARLLEGAGRVHRHVKLRQPADLARPELRALMVRAVGLRRTMYEAHPRGRGAAQAQ